MNRYVVEDEIQAKESLITNLKAANKEQAEVIEKFFEQSAEQLEKIKSLERQLHPYVRQA